MFIYPKIMHPEIIVDTERSFSNVAEMLEKYKGMLITPETLHCIKFDVEQFLGDGTKIIVDSYASEINISRVPVESKPLPLPPSKKIDYYSGILEPLLAKYRLSQNEIKFAVNKIRNAIRGKSCTDNFRMADPQNKSEMTEYRKRKSEGCCGFYDDVIEFRSGKRIKFGFNYGH